MCGRRSRRVRSAAVDTDHPDQIPAVDADYSRGSDDDVSVTNDGVANDGEAGEGDNVLSVEKLFIFA